MLRADDNKRKLDDILKSLHKLRRSPEGIDAEDGRTEGQLPGSVNFTLIPALRKVLYGVKIN